MLTVERRPTATGTQLALVAAAGVRINALLKPVLEQPDGTVRHFDAAGRSPDSAYFISAPTLELKGSTEGLVRASVCPSGQQVCRAVTIAVQGRP